MALESNSQETAYNGSEIPLPAIARTKSSSSLVQRMHVWQGGRRVSDGKWDVWSDSEVSGLALTATERARIALSAIRVHHTRLRTS